MFGDILSDEASGLIGGLGLMPGAKIGEDTAIFEPAHGSAPDIADQGIANPSALVLAGCVLLDHIGQPEVAEAIRDAPSAALRGDVLTRDLGGRATTREFADGIIEELE
ncbi:MAG: isocitrate/isopropylmalate family dehydrogenase [Gemmatimonadales bacterium]|jgi:isocitrate dehydrogenase (NAD+)